VSRYVIKAAASLEIIVGAIFIFWPGIPCMLVFGASPESIGWPLARWVGIGLLALGIACLPSKIADTQDRTVLGLLSFNVGIVVLLAWVGIRTTTHGLLPLACRGLAPSVLSRVANRVTDPFVAKRLTLRK
jgi:hypothetical protein